MKLARWIFGIAGVYGILVIAPLYFAEGQIAQNDPPAITHPEFFYGFIGVTLAWQLVFLVIARNPVRYRPLMLASVLEKLAYGIPAIALFMQQRIKTMTLAFGCIDLLLGALFVLAFFFTPRASGAAVAPASTDTIPPAPAPPARSAG
jgi:hypothetical protein